MLKVDLHGVAHVLKITEFFGIRMSCDLLVRAGKLPAAFQVARAHPKLTLVLDHLAKPEIRAGGLTTWNAALAPLESLPNVFVILSGLVTEADWTTWTAEQIVPYLKAVLKRVGPDRCLYGSDTDSGKFRSVYGIFPSGASATQCGFRELEERLVGFQTLRKWTESV